MARPIAVEVVMDDDSYLKGAASIVSTNTKLGTSYAELADRAKLSADAQVAAAVKSAEAQRAKISALQGIAASSPAGSSQSIAASNLAVAAQGRLARSYGATEEETSKLSTSSRAAERDIGKVTRGALAGTGAFTTFGRSLAFASGGFLAFAGISSAIKDAVTGAESLQKANDSLGVVIRRNNGDVGQAIPLLDKWATAQERLGVSESDALTGLKQTTVLTGSVQKGMLAYTMALELSRAENVSLSSAMRIAGKAIQGQTTSLTRYGIVLPKTTNAQKIFSAFQAKFAQQAETNTSAFDKLRASLSDIETKVGTALIPTFEKYARELSAWLSNTKNQQRVTDDVRTAFTALVDAFKLAATVIKTVNKVTGSFVHTLELLATIKLASSLSKIIVSFQGVGTAAEEAEGGIAGMGSAATAALGPIGLLAAALAGLYEANKHFNGGFNIDPFGDRTTGNVTAEQKAYADSRFGGYNGSFDQWKRSPMGRRFIAQHPYGSGPGSSRYGSPGDGEQQQAAAQRRRRNVLGRTPRASAPSTLQLPFPLQLAQARADATTSTADDVAVAKRIKAYILNVLPHLHGQKLIEAYSILGQANATIASAISAAAAKAKKAATTAKKVQDSFSEPAALEIAEARAQALGLPDTSILLKMKRAAERALKSGKLSAQGQIDAWNEIASVNQQLNSTAQSALGSFKQLNVEKLSKKIKGLTKAQQKQLQALLSQVGPNGTVPGSGVGAYGYVVGKNGRPQHVHNHIYIDGKPVAQSVTKHQQRAGRRRSRQRRGPTAGG